jgi:hypothetical protein
VYKAQYRSLFVSHLQNEADSKKDEKKLALRRVQLAIYRFRKSESQNFKPPPSKSDIFLEMPLLKI